MAEVVSFTGVPERLDLDGGTVVRRYTRDDIPRLVDAVNMSLESLRPWMPWAQAPITVEAQTQWFEAGEQHWDAGTEFTYGVFDAGGDVLGGTGFHVRNGPGVLEIGYWLRSDQEGRGLMTRVVQALTQAARDVPGATRVEIHCDIDNAGSAGVPRRVGYRLAEVRAVDAVAPAETGRQQIWVLDL